MKKLWLGMLIIIFIILLAGCANQQTTENTNDIEDLSEKFQDVAESIVLINEKLDNLNNYDDTELQSNVVSLENEMLELEQMFNDLDAEFEALEERLNSITISEGLNNRVSFYENAKSSYMSLNNTFEQMKTSYDKTKGPEYMFDLEGNELEVEDLVLLLKEKYFNDTTTGVPGVAEDYLGNEGILHIRFVIQSDMVEEEVLARMILLIDELRLYDAMIDSYTNIKLEVYRIDSVDHQTRISIPIGKLLSDWVIIDAETIYTEGADSSLETDTVVDTALIQNFYDEFITNKTFSGYVLDYKKNK